MRISMVVLGGLIALSACTTTSGTRGVTAEERQQCRAMAQRMGTRPVHNHAERRRVVGRSQMNRRHDRCRAIADAQAREVSQAR